MAEEKSLSNLVPKGLPLVIGAHERDRLGPGPTPKLRHGNYRQMVEEKALSNLVQKGLPLVIGANKHCF
jgi:hypothetical protein